MTRSALSSVINPAHRRRKRGGEQSIHAHYLVAETARELCLATYEATMGNNAVRAEWKRRHPGMGELGLQAAFIKRYIASHLAPARTTLGLMLRQSAMDPKQKELIHQALVLDNTLSRGRNPQIDSVSTTH